MFNQFPVFVCSVAIRCLEKEIFPAFVCSLLLQIKFKVQATSIQADCSSFFFGRTVSQGACRRQQWVEEETSRFVLVVGKMGPPPRLVVMALVAAVLVAALFAVIAFKIVNSRKALEKEKNDDKRKSKPKPTDANWEWPIFDEWYSRDTWSYERKQRGAEDEEQESSPFVVTYRRQKNWPDKMTVTLFSSHLVAIIAKRLPKSNKAMTDTNPKILGQQLFLAMDTIRSYKIEEEYENSAGTAENLEESENSVATAKKLKESKSTSSTAKKLEKSENTASLQSSSKRKTPSPLQSSM